MWLLFNTLVFKEYQWLLPIRQIQLTFSNTIHYFQETRVGTHHKVSCCWNVKFDFDLFQYFFKEKQVTSMKLSKQNFQSW